MLKSTVQLFTIITPFVTNTFKCTKRSTPKPFSVTFIIAHVNGHPLSAQHANSFTCEVLESNPLPPSSRHRGHSLLPLPHPCTAPHPATSVGSFVIACILFGKSKNSLDFERRYHKLYRKLGCHFFFTF